MTLRDARHIALGQLACDYCCAPEDFLRSENTVVIQRGHPQRRMYSEQPVPFSAGCFGYGVVVSVAPELYDWAVRTFTEPLSYHTFEANRITGYARDLEAADVHITQIYDYYLFDPATPCAPVLPDGFTLRLYAGESIKQELYSDRRFGYALLYEDAFRKDTIAVAAVRDGQIAAMAGASDDGERMWQVGVDVLPEFRGAGLGQAVVYALSREIDSLGKVAFYSTWAAHIASRTIAHRCGYAPGFVELMSKR